MIHRLDSLYKTPSLHPENTVNLNHTCDFSAMLEVVYTLKIRSPKEYSVSRVWIMELVFQLSSDNVKEIPDKQGELNRGRKVHF